MKAYKESRLDSGLRILVSEDENSEIVTLTLWIRAGSRFERPDERGFAHLLEHMLLKGTQSRPSAFEISINTDRAGAYLNANTSIEKIEVIIQVAKEYCADMFDLLADIALHPLLDEGVLENEKKVILEELKQAHDARSRRLWIETVSRLFAGHPLANYALGTEDGVRNATTEKLRSYYGRFFSPDRIAVVVAGGVTMAEILKLVKKSFGNVQKKETPAEDLIKPNCPTGYSFQEVRGGQTNINLCFPGRPLNFHESILLDVIANFLGYGHTSVLYQELRHKRGLAYSISASEVLFRDAAMLYIATGTTAPEEVVSAVKQLIGNLDGIFSEKLFEELKEQYANVLLRRTSDQMNETSSIGDHWIRYDKLISLQELKKEIKSLRYTEALSIAREFLDLKKLFIMSLGEKEPKFE